MMRGKRTFRAKMPTTQEAFVDCVKNEKTVIVLNHSLLACLDKELNESKGNKSTKKMLNTGAKVIGVYGFLALEPLLWIYSAALLLWDGLLKDTIKGYDVYSGLDINDEDIIVLIRKENYDPKYDTIKYDETYVKSVSEKPLKGKVKAIRNTPPVLCSSTGLDKIERLG